MINTPKQRNVQILVVDDDNRIRELLQQYLESEGFKADSAKNAKEARQFLEKTPYDLMVLDVMMPGETGFELLSDIRKTNKIPVIMLTAVSESQDRIKGLTMGADDYLAKPFEPQELILRIENIIKRRPENEIQIKFGDYSFNLETGDLLKGQEFVSLTSREQKLLEIFIKNIDKPVSRSELSKQLFNIGERSIDVQVNRLRKKIEPDSKNPFYLQSSWGEGYILKSRRDTN